MINKKRQAGVVSIEFSVGFMAFWLMCMAWAEMSYMSYASAMGDLAISRASREVKVVEGSSPNYLAQFRHVIGQSTSLWGNVIDPNEFSVSVHYLRDLAALKGVKESCEPDPSSDSDFQRKNKTCGGTATNKALAIYRLSYNYEPMFSYFITTNSLFVREVIVIQEYQRDQFN